MKSGNTFAARELYALVFGLFLGLCILKFGDPVILDWTILPPASLSEYWRDSWPIAWANWLLLPLVAAAAVVFVAARRAPLRRRYPRWLLLLPLLWLGWQLVSASKTVDANLTAVTLWQYAGCVACFFIGAFLLAAPRALHFLMAGLLAAFTLCLVRGIQQRFEFPVDAKILLQGQHEGWTNLPPQTVFEMKQDETIIMTNGVEIANPAIVAKFAKGRVMGTLVYPNALAGLVLLLFPVSFVVVWKNTRVLRPVVRGAAMAVTVALAAAAFYWSGSKFGWLIAMGIAGLCLLFRLPWPFKTKIAVVAAVTVLGLGVFFVRFHHYFAKGATSVVARLDYWHAALQTTASHPLFGTGPGTFQRPYARLKAPDAEMSRLVHNDYLEQFSDSGVIGGILYASWIVSGLIFIGKSAWKTHSQLFFALFLGLLGWFIQGLAEFGLFIPALAWTAFLFLGCALGLRDLDSPESAAATNPFDKKAVPANIPSRY